MSNINVTNSCSSLEFLGDYEIKSVEMKSGSELSGEAIMRLLIDNEEYELRVSIKEGKKEGIGLLLREDGTLFMRMMFVNDECEGEVIKKNKYGITVLKGRVSKGKEVGMWIEYDDGTEIWRGLYRNGKRCMTLKEQEGMKGFYSEVNMNGELLSVSEYDDKWMKNGICFEVESGHLKRECVYENGMKKRVIREFTDDGLMRLFDDNGKKVYEGVWFGDMMNGFVIHPEMEGMKGFFKEMNVNRELLSVSEYDEWRKNGKCFEYEGGRLVRECEYKNGVMIRVLREWKGECMIEYDVNGIRVYEGGFEGDMMKGFVREGEGKEYGIDGKSALYVGGWKKGLREGYGSEFKGLNPVYIGEWKNGLRDGIGEEYDENEEVIRSGKWIKGEYSVMRYEDGYGNDLSVFDIDCLKGIERLEIGNDCFKKVNRFVIDGLNELKSIIIGKKSFYFDIENSRLGSKCVIMNCDQLRQIHIGEDSFYWYKSFELKNLPSLISIQLDHSTFKNCHWIVFDSMND